MRRLAVVLAEVVMVLWVAAPASAFGHGAVADPYAHALLDLAIPAAVTAPLWTAYLWGARHRRLLLALVAFVQVPVAALCFVSVTDPAVQIATLGAGLGATVLSLVLVRRRATSSTAAAERR